MRGPMTRTEIRAARGVDDRRAGKHLPIDAGSRVEKALEANGT